MSKERRTEKSWRHRDRELQGTHTLSSAVITLNAILIAAFSIVLTRMTQNRIVWILTTVFFVFSITSVLIVSVNIGRSRNLDRQRAKYFEDSISPYTDNTDEHENKDKEYKDKLQRESKDSTTRERIAIELTIGSIILIFMYLMSHV